MQSLAGIEKLRRLSIYNVIYYASAMVHRWPRTSAKRAGCRLTLLDGYMSTDNQGSRLLVAGNGGAWRLKHKICTEFHEADIIAFYGSGTLSFEARGNGKILVKIGDSRSIGPPNVWPREANHARYTYELKELA